MTPRVLNYRKDGFPEGAVDIMRPSKWGNPFLVTPKMSRGTALRRFAQWVEQPAQAALRAAARISLRGKDLVCCCAPKPCHGDIWLRIANG